MKRLRFKPYIDQKEKWPDQGRVILAQYDDQSVVVYQAYTGQIGKAAARQGTLAVPGFSFERMSWIKTGFLWMMYRSDWGSKPGQETILAIWIQRAAFDTLLHHAVNSHFTPQLYDSRDSWQAELDASDVLVQWDPDHPPHGPKLKRRAIQLGLRGETLRRYANDWIIHIEDITSIVHEQAEFQHMPEFLLTPAERIYPVHDPALARRLELDKFSTR